MTHHIPAATDHELGLRRTRHALDMLGGAGTADRVDRVALITAEFLAVGVSVDEALAIAGSLSGQTSWETIANNYLRLLAVGHISAADVAAIARRLEPHP